MDDDEPHDLLILDPADIDWTGATLLQVTPYDCGRAFEMTVTGPVTLLPMPGTDRRYAVEVVFRDDTWDRVLWTADKSEAVALVHRLSAMHDVPVRKDQAVA